MCSLIVRTAIFLILSRVVEINAQVYNSVFAMEAIYKTHEDLVRKIETYVEKAKYKLNVMEQALKGLIKNHEFFVKDVQLYLQNPINIFYLLLGLTYNLDYIETTVKDKTGFVRNKQLLYPGMEDVKGAMLGMLRLQETYKLKVSDLARGILIGHFNEGNLAFMELATGMTSWDCFELAGAPWENNTLGYQTMISWLKEALYKYHRWQDCLFCPFQEEDIVDHLSKAHHLLGDTDGEVLWLKKRISLTPNDSKNEEREKIIKDLENVKYIQHLESKMGETSKPIKDRSQLRRNRWKLSGCYEDFAPARLGYCMYDRFSPCLMLSPAKLNMLTYSPPIAMYYDFLSVLEIETLIELAKNSKMSTSTSYKMEKAEPVTDNDLDSGRVAKQASVNESVDAVARIMHRIKDYTGLNLANSGPLAVINYGIAGYFGEHYDPYFEPPPTQLNERSASVVLFLSEPIQGGAIVFPNLSLKIYPERGSMLVFDSVYPSGVINMWTKHSACPVFRGDKWIAIKWTNEDEQLECPLWFDKISTVFTADRHELFMQHDKLALADQLTGFQPAPKVTFSKRPDFS